MPFVSCTPDSDRFDHGLKWGEENETCYGFDPDDAQSVRAAVEKAEEQRQAIKAQRARRE